jgi:hypothetical protein
MRYIIFLLFIGLANCATVRSTHEDYPFAEPSVIKYVDSFVKDSKGSVHKRDLYMTTIGFDDLSSLSAVGVCYPNPFGSEIYIDKDWWENNTDYLEREQLIYHEIGHCTLLKMHTKPTDAEGFFGWLERLTFRLGIKERSDMLSDGCPTSYMYPYLLEKSCINNHYDYYIDELFGRADTKKYKEEIAENMRVDFWDER